MGGILQRSTTTETNGIVLIQASNIILVNNTLTRIQRSTYYSYIYIVDQKEEQSNRVFRSHHKRYF